MWRRGKLAASLKKLALTFSKYKSQFLIIENKRFTSKATFRILFLVYLLSYFSLLRENVNYVDDTVRTVLGLSNWNIFSRYSSEYLSSLIHADNNFLADCSPIPQLIAIFEISLASLILLKGITGKKEFTVFQIAASLILGLTPYFLGCISFKYDSPYTALSVLCAVIPLLFIKYSKIFFLSTFVCVIIICTSYQVSLGILPMTVIFTLLSQYVKGDSFKNVLKTGVLFALSFVIGCIIFKTFIMPTPEDYGYISTVVAPLNSLPSIFFRNMRKFFEIVINDFSTFYLVVFLLGCFVVVLSLINSKKRKYIVLILSLVVLILCTLLTYGFYAILEKPFFGARAFYVIGALISCIFIFTVSFKDMYITKICSFIMAWSFVVFSSAYENAIVAQKEWEDFRMKEVIYDLASVENNGQNFKYNVIGSVGFAPKIEKLVDHYPFLRKLVYVTFKDSVDYWGTRKFILFYGIKNTSIDNSISDATNPKLVKETMYHQLKIFDDKVLITLK